MPVIYTRGTGILPVIHARGTGILPVIYTLRLLTVCASVASID